ncbi:MAG: hypothetical protein HYY84_17970 [Deltaproteobacteria bacterium]|nr:hypothetical protein [Deltaproteobacteria bacterium]
MRRKLLDNLGVERAESAAARSEQETATKELRTAEVALARLFDRLVAADEAAALDRVEAARQTRIVARPVTTTPASAVATTAANTTAAPAPNCDR